MRRPFRWGDISTDGPRLRGDCGVLARGLGVVFLGGVCEILALGKRENPPDGAFDDDMMLPDFLIKLISPNSISKQNNKSPSQTSHWPVLARQLGLASISLN